MNQSSAWRLRTLREERGFEQQDVAALIGVHPATLARIERGEQQPSLPEICALLVTFQKTFRDLFRAELELAEADVFARVTEYQPSKSTSPKTANRDLSLRTLRAALDALHC